MAFRKVSARIPTLLALMFRKRTWNSNSPDKTVEIGRSIGRKLKPGTVVALTGELGSGKTTLVKGIALGLGVKSKREVTSPTFVIFHIYKGRIPLYHFDLYRLERNSDLEAIGMDEFLDDPDAVSVIEWAERISSVPGRSDVQIKLIRKSENQRIIRIHPHAAFRSHTGD